MVAGLIAIYLVIFIVIAIIVFFIILIYRAFKEIVKSFTEEYYQSNDGWN